MSQFQFGTGDLQVLSADLMLSQESFGLSGLASDPAVESPLGNENICFEDYPGEYDFQVIKIPYKP